MPPFDDFIMPWENPYFGYLFARTTITPDDSSHGSSVTGNFCCTYSYVAARGPFLLTRVSKYIHYNEKDEITYPFPNSNGITIGV